MAGTRGRRPGPVRPTACSRLTTRISGSKRGCIYEVECTGVTVMKVFLSSDMEGTAGVVDWEQCIGPGPEAAAGRELLLAEVNAAIEGAIAGGATEIVVNDSHANMRNLPPGQLLGEASYISGSHKPLYMMQGLD